jgi:hypothetical protein
MKIEQVSSNCFAVLSKMNRVAVLRSRGTLMRPALQKCHG